MKNSSPHFSTVDAGTVGWCKQCGREKEFTNEILRNIVRKHFPNRVGETIYVSELIRFRCSSCGAKEIQVHARPRDGGDPSSEHSLQAKRDDLLHLARNGSLTHMQLSLIIDNAQSYVFTEEEVTQLREIQRRADPISKHSTEMCPSCGMVGSNCTCGRSWF